MRRFVLRRGACWIACPHDARDEGAMWVDGLFVSSDPRQAWMASTLDLAHERQKLLGAIHGWSTRIQAVHVEP